MEKERKGRNNLRFKILLEKEFEACNEVKLVTQYQMVELHLKFKVSVLRAFCTKDQTKVAFESIRDTYLHYVDMYPVGGMRIQEVKTYLDRDIPSVVRARYGEDVDTQIMFAIACDKENPH